jgi:hypothetical protein
VIIDKNYNILSIIYWESAGMVPWEVVELPLFLDTGPSPMDLPTKYDTEGTLQTRAHSRYGKNEKTMPEMASGTELFSED